MIEKNPRVHPRRLHALGDRLEDALDGVKDLQFYARRVVELNSEVNEERVAEILARISCEGVALNQAYFILTRLSVWWEKGRRQLEEFSRSAERPSLPAGPFNHYIQRTPIRACVLR